MCVLAGLSACGGAAPISQPARQPPQKAVVSKPVEPPPSASWSPDYEVEERFLDPERVQKLESAFPEIDDAIDKTQAELKLPGLAVGIVIDGRLAHVATAGQRDQARQLPVTPETVFRIASVTKTLTAAAIVKLRDAGKLELDAPASKYLPELARVRYPTRDSRPITLRHLLTHSSGLARDVHGAKARATVTGPTSNEVARLVEGMRVAFAPGSQVSYSNLGYTLLGVVIERVAKVSYRSYLEKSFLEPLGMKSAAWEEGRVSAEFLARSYERGKDGALTPVEKHEVLGIGDASGGLYLSVSDLGRWVGWQLSAYPARSAAESGPLARATIREMHEVSGGIAVHVTSPFTTLQNWVAEPWAGGMTLGWSQTALCDMGAFVEKAGRIDAYSTEVEMFPSEGIGIFLLTNTESGGAVKRRAVFDSLKLLRRTGGVAARVRTSKRSPTLDQALGRLTAVMNQWNEADYKAMLTANHKEHVPVATEKAELEGYAKLHGRCSGGSILSFDSEEHARYLVKCERGRLEMNLSVIDGFIGGFTGISTEVDAEPRARAAAVAALLDRKQRERFGNCKLGKLKERVGLGVHRFEVSCDRGPAQLSLQMEAGAVKPDTLHIERATTSECAELGR